MRVAERVYGGCRRCPPSIHQVLERVEERDRMLAAISCEVAVVEIDHCQAGPHVPERRECRQAGAETERRVGVAQIVGLSEWLDGS